MKTDWSHHGRVEEEVFDEDSCPVVIYRRATRWETFWQYVWMPFGWIIYAAFFIVQLFVALAVTGYYRARQALGLRRKHR